MNQVKNINNTTDWILLSKPINEGFAHWYTKTINVYDNYKENQTEKQIEEKEEEGKEEEEEEYIDNKYKEIIKWWKSQKGKIEAEKNLDVYNGLCYEHGYGVIQNFKEAFKWYYSAALLNKPLAIFKLGLCYEFGIGTNRDYKEAVKWYKKAVNMNQIDAMYHLGLCYEYGIGVNLDYQNALELYKKVCNKEYPIVKSKINKLERILNK